MATSPLGANASFSPLGANASLSGQAFTPSQVTPLDGAQAALANRFYRELINVGFTPEQAKIGVAIAGAESTFNPRAHNPRGADNSYGLGQINMLGAMGPDRRAKLGISSNEELFDIATNAKAMKLVFDEAGGSWSPWTTYGSGKYKKYMTATQGDLSPAAVGKLNDHTQSAFDKLSAEMVKNGYPPLEIVSGYRSPQKNASLPGAAKNSQHLYGRAVDIKGAINMPKEQRDLIIQLAPKYGFQGIGNYKSGKLHLDTGPSRTWS
jgi:hypothetical protein